MVKFDTETVRLIDLFQRITNTKVIDCIVKEDAVYFVIDNIKAGIGKEGNKVRKVERALKRKVKLFEYSDNPEKFINNMIPHIEKLELEDDIVRIQVDSYFKARIIGKGGRNINIVREFLIRLTPVKKLKVR